MHEFVRQCGRLFQIHSPRSDDDLACNRVRICQRAAQAFAEPHHVQVVLEIKDWPGSCLDQLTQKQHQSPHAILELRVVFAGTHARTSLMVAAGNVLDDVTSCSSPQSVRW